MKRILKYISIFIFTVFMAIFLLDLSTKIPNENVRENINNSVDAFMMNKKYRIFDELSKRDYGVRHIYGDAMISNIIWYLNPKDSLKSAVEANFYSLNGQMQIDFGIDKLSEDIPFNNQYLRYWHGYIVFFKPLLLFFTIKQIYIIDVILLSILTIYLIILLWKENMKEVLIAFIVGFIMCIEIIVPFCMECTLIYAIMIIASIIAIKLDEKQKDLGLLFFITGMLTCYFDFLTNEITTLFIPFIIVFVKRCKENKINNFKEAFNFLVKSAILWLIGYAGMYVAKWVVASIVLNKSIVDIWNNYVKENLFLRVNGDTYNFSKLQLTFEAVKRNYSTLFPLYDFRSCIVIYLIPIFLIIFEMIFINKREIKKQWKSAILFIIAIIPYIRYAALSNHSFWHSIFTFRTQIITIMAIILAIYYSVDKEIMKKEIKIGKIKHGKRINNTNSSTK